MAQKHVSLVFEVNLRVPETNKQASLLNNTNITLISCVPHHEFKASSKFVEHISLTQGAQQSVTISIATIVTFLATPEAGAKHEVLFKKTIPRGRFVENQSVAKIIIPVTSVTKCIEMSVKNLVAPKAAAKHELSFNKPNSEVGLLNKSTC